jgi:hypothetical protein
MKNPLAEFYQWEVEHRDQSVVRQYNEDRSENPSSLIRPAEVVRASILPRIPGLPRHDVGLDPARDQRFVRRFGRSFEKRTETNIEAILALYKYVVEDGRIRRVDWSMDAAGRVTATGEDPALRVFGITPLVPIADAFSVMRLAGDSTLEDFLVNMRVANPHKGADGQPPFYRTLAERLGLKTKLNDILSALGLRPTEPFGTFLGTLGFPKQGSKFEYIHCIVTTHYRMWVFSSSGQVLITNPEYELYL